MHQVAVIVLCALVAWFVWRDLAELFIAWYSGVEPPLTTGIPTGIKVGVWCRTGIGVTAMVIALWTLRARP